VVNISISMEYDTERMVEDRDEMNDTNNVNTSCWLCNFCTDVVAQNIHEMIVKNIHLMAPEAIASQCVLVIKTALQDRGATSEEHVVCSC
jgi:hypothetical protein